MEFSENITSAKISGNIIELLQFLGKSKRSVRKIMSPSSDSSFVVRDRFSVTKSHSELFHLSSAQLSLKFMDI